MISDKSLVFYYGAMGSGKTRKLQGDYFSKIQDDFDVIVIKPKLDTKGNNKTLARDGGMVEAKFLIKEKDNIYMIVAEYLVKHNLDFILVDEAQFLSKHHVDELTDIVDILGINVICYGLRTDFRGELFEGSRRLFECADKIEALNRQCRCGNEKIYNMRIIDGSPVFDGEVVAIDGVDVSYKSVCRKCYKDAMRKELDNKK